MVHWVKSLLCHNHDYHGICHNLAYLFKDNTMSTTGVTLAQLVKASVGQSDVQGFEPHLGHN